MRVAPIVALLCVPSITVAQDAEPAASEAPAAGTTTYTLTPASSDLYVVIRNDTDASLSRLGHDHVIYANTFTGTVNWPNEAGQGCAIDISVPVSSLVVDPPGLRAKAGLDNNTIDDDDKESLKKNMYGKSQLDSKDYSVVTFKGTKCEGTTGKVKVSGTITVRDTPVPVSLTMDVQADGSAFSAKGAVNLTHTAFGFKPFSASFIGPRNQDKLTFAVHVKGTAK